MHGAEIDWALLPVGSLEPMETRRIQDKFSNFSGFDPTTKKATTTMNKATTTMKKRNSGSKEGKGGDSPSQLIDARIKELSDWRGEMLARVRILIKQADPEVVEEWKWRGVPVWSHDLHR
jgi:hypothetical protein